MKKINSLKTIKLLALFFISSLALVSCSSDDDHDDDHEHEEELITTVIYTLEDANGNTVTLTFEDLDGDGGADGTTEVSGSFVANTQYSGSIQLLNETEDPAEDITEEVEEEGDEHEFFYTSTISDIVITKTDVDEDGNPIGIDTSFTTGEAGTGSLTIVLKHEPTKPNDGTSENAGGSTDVEVTFAIEVE
ncbi:type 1 periplasmic binding fold superfamily protein [Tamlana sp. 62-3]|uniref:Type 1 periplasmic binding fold superfamily protein n=1 Tax=Neotamlana sargassicola TaxID=2883125 RepID=A0A9X1L6T7_9FLAO|nr:type 1 periplasmic binding fold superfamily protein [Tamlana sargassicola]MCB4808116.1 type 1 periplasmic binding fold superfamily protein [Tamlana sargassicola]